MNRKLLTFFASVFAFGCATGQPAKTPPMAGGKNIVLVHGFLETGATFRMLKKRLEKRGANCLIIRLTPSDGRGGLEKLARQLQQDIHAKFGDKEPVSIVAFSMGGLVSRHYLQCLDGANRCENFITVSSPHHGTRAAWLYPSKGAEEMRPGSQFLADLTATEAKLGKIPITSYRTPMDLIILPPTSSIWERAENLEYPVILHPLMLTSKPILTDIERRLFEQSLKK